MAYYTQHSQNVKHFFQNSKNYFSEVEEAAVLRYCNSNDDIEKNRIYNQYLHAPFVKMVESLIKRLDRVHIDIINNDDNITITYTDHLGNVEYGSVLKVRADE